MLPILLERVSAGHLSSALYYYKILIGKTPKLLPDILMPLYKRLEKYPQDFDLRIMISELYIAAGLYPEAIQELEEIIDLDPEYSQAFFLLGKIIGKNKGKEVILPILEGAFEKGVYDLNILDLLPSLYLEKGLIDKSIVFFERMIQENPEVSHFYNMLAELHLKKGNFEEVVYYYRCLVEKFPNLSEESGRKISEIIKKHSHYPNLYVLLGHIFFKTCCPEKGANVLELLQSKHPQETSLVVSEYKKALKIYPQDGHLKLGLAKALIEIAEYTESVEILESLSKEISADVLISLLNRILSAFPHQVLALTLMAKLYYSLESYDKGLGFLETLIPLDYPKLSEKLGLISDYEAVLHPALSPKMNFMKAKAYYHHEEFSNCLHLCEQLMPTELEQSAKFLKIKCLQSKKQTSDFLNQLILYIQEYPYDSEGHQLLKAVQEKHLFQQLDSLQKKSPIDFVKLGLLFLRKGEFVSAIEQFQKIKNPTFSLLLNARCFFEQGRFDLSLNQIQSFLSSPSLDPPFMNSARFMASIACLLLGEQEDAQLYLDQILQDDIAFPFLDHVQNHIKQSPINIRGHALSLILDPSPLPVMVSNPEDLEMIQKKKLNFQSFALPHNNNGVMHLLKKNLRSAETEFHLGIQMDATLSIVYNNLGVLYFFEKKLKEAYFYLEKAEKLNPNLELIHLNRALFYLSENKEKEAFLSFQRIIERAPQNSVLWINLGDFYFKKQDLKKAFFYWEKASETCVLFPFVQRRICYLDANSFQARHWLKPDVFRYQAMLRHLGKQEK